MTMNRAESLIIEHKHTIELSATLTDGQLRVTYGGVNLREHGGTLVDRVHDGQVVEVVLQPFTHGGQPFHVYAVTVGPDGVFYPWDRDADGVLRSRAYGGTDLRFVLVAADETGRQIHSDDWPVIIVDPM